METDITQQKNLSQKEVLGYGFYMFAGTVAAITFAFLNMFWPERGFDMALFSTALLVSRIVDFVVTLFIGPIMEKVKLTIGGGRYRPWLFVFQFVAYIGVVICFFDPGSTGLRFLVVVIGSILVNAAMGFISVALFGILPQMAGASAVDRNRLTAWNYRLMTAATVVTSLGGAYILTWIGYVVPYPYNYLVMTAAFALFYFLGVAVIRGVSKPYDIRLEDMAGGMSMPSVSLKDMAKAVATNGQLLIYLLANTIAFTGLMAMFNIMIYYWRLIVPYTHGIAMDAAFPGLYTIGNTLTTLASLVFSLFGPQLGIKMNSKARAMWVGLLFAVVSGVLNFFFGAGMWALYIAIGMLATFGASLYSGFGINYALDCGEYGFWKTGQDNRLVIMSMTNMPMKISGIIGGLILYALYAIGYDAEVANYSIYVLGELPGFVDDLFVTNFMILLVLVPAACNLVAAALMAFAYKIKDADAARYAAENMERMQAMGMGMPPMGPPPDAPDAPAEA